MNWEGQNRRTVDEQKVFCIGRNKTGTTSLKKALAEFGYLVGNQRAAERLIDAYAVRDFEPIISYCQTAEAFQDVPFSFPYTYIVLDQEFPGSKFILTVRSGGGEACYDSYLRHQSQRLGLNRLPNAEELKKDTYVYQGWSYKVKQALAPITDDKLYDKEQFVQLYERHVTHVMQYFAHRPEDLLVINVADRDSYDQLCDFLGQKPLRERMPWENKTRK